MKTFIQYVSEDIIGQHKHWDENVTPRLSEAISVKDIEPKSINTLGIISRKIEGEDE